MAIHQGLDKYLSYKSLVKDTKTRWIIEFHHFISFVFTSVVDIQVYIYIEAC